MGKTIIEKTVGAHAGRRVAPGDLVHFEADVILARDFDGACVARALLENSLPVGVPDRTFFAFDFNPTASDRDYAAVQQFCRTFARDRGIKVYDVNRGIASHLALEDGLAAPGRTLVSTGSHAGLVGAVGAFGMGLGPQDISHAIAFGTVWFVVPPTVKVVLEGRRGPGVDGKDLALAVLRNLVPRGVREAAVELYGDLVNELSLSERITIASMANEMGAVTLLIPPSAEVIGYCQRRSRSPFDVVQADPDAEYSDEIVVNVDDLKPLIARPGRVSDVLPASEVAGRPVDSVLVGSCTNGTFEDLASAARVLEGRRVADGVVLKIVPATDGVWRACLERGLVAVFKEAGALFGNAGCAGCAAGQIGFNGPGEVTVSTGNRNVTGKQGYGDIYLASPATAAATSVAGGIATAADVFRGAYERPASERSSGAPAGGHRSALSSRRRSGAFRGEKPSKISGSLWLIDRDDIDTDMIYSDVHLNLTDVEEMGRHAFGGLEGWEGFPNAAEPGDIIVTGRNFGCGDPKPQAVDCLLGLGIALIVARSFDAAFRRNAITAGLPVLEADLAQHDLRAGDEMSADLLTGAIEVPSRGVTVRGVPFSGFQMDVYQRGGLLKLR